ncbi:MAG TPA: 1-deoxy-D-xylulose-5-phosphate reductoisomerase [Thermoanaerobaculia bacterium]|nr:1-deoxy-D-xylulose-5-phosphate reductoisomerase [Thermoanaerobaculia bacterium]
MKNLAVLGSTGSIGRAALEVVSAFPERFRAVAFAAGRSVERLAEQVSAHRPELVSVERREDAKALAALLPPGPKPRIVFGPEGLDEVAAFGKADTVVGGLVGALGLRSAFAAVSSGKRLALANKEPLVVAGELILSQAARSGAEVLPVDSEHSAIHQALRCGGPAEVERLVLTASGGPFRQRDLATFSTITVEDALAHPTWKMGPKITVDSATMMNKGLEIIEAHFLFRLPPEKIDVVIHPQSAVHSLVEFRDGSLVAQLARNDMKLPILYALSYPDRVANAFGRLDLLEVARLEFFEVEPERYPAVALARAALGAGGGMPAVLNAGNEVAVEAFLEGKISFPDIVSIVAETLDAAGQVPTPASLEEAETIDRESRQSAQDAVRARMSKSPGAPAGSRVPAARKESEQRSPF